MSTSTHGRAVRAVRGATAADADTPDAIRRATAELLREMIARNGAAPGDLISIIFTATPDLGAAFPATAARELGISGVPLLCAQEIEVPGDVERCIRILVHLETDRAGDDLKHVYLGAAGALRRDLADG